MLAVAYATTSFESLETSLRMLVAQAGIAPFAVDSFAPRPSERARAWATLWAAMREMDTEDYVAIVADARIYLREHMEELDAYLEGMEDP